MRGRDPERRRPIADDWVATRPGGGGETFQKKRNGERKEEGKRRRPMAFQDVPEKMAAGTLFESNFRGKMNAIQFKRNLLEK